MRRERRTIVTKEHLVPAWCRVLMTPAARQQMALVQLQLLADIHTGRATEETLWDMVRNGLTWSRVSDLAGAGIEEMNDYLGVLTRMVYHYGATGRVEFTSQGDDEAARLASAYMEDLAGLCTKQQAIEAANWSEARVAAMQLQPGLPMRDAA